MAPVIRVSDEVFRRLQRISEPLVDSSSRVIDRVLTHYETTALGGASAPKAVVDRRVASAESRQSLGSEPSADAKLFVAPASDANLSRTIQRSVSLSAVGPILTDDQVNELRSALKNATAFHCWAMTESRRMHFDAMSTGDVVLLITRQTAFSGRVQHKLISERLGNSLWDSQPRLPWKFIYLLTDVRERRVRKELLSRALGYNPSFTFPGVSRVRPEPLRAALDQFGTIEKLLDACA